MENTTFKDALDTAFKYKDWKAFVQTVIKQKSVSDIVEIANYDEVDEDAGYKLKFVEGYTGSEGRGEETEAVIEVSKDNELAFFFRVYGYYCSYGGTEWNDSFTIVEPVQVLVTQYKDVQ